MAGPLVTCANLVKIYKVPNAGVEVVALQGLDLEVRAGELLAIVGRSGSGKSTLMNILGGLDEPSAGQCSVAGHLLTRMGERERNTYRRFVVGHVWQHSGRNLVSDLTLADNVGLPQMLAGAGARQRRRRSRELLGQVGLGEMTRKRPDQLSGGEQQRGAIAVALANGPQVLLADEPTGELDDQSAGENTALLHTLTRSLGVTVILVTHDPSVAAAADRTIAIRDGRTSTETVRRAPPEGAVTTQSNQARRRRVRRPACRQARIAKRRCWIAPGACNCRRRRCAPCASTGARTCASAATTSNCGPRARGRSRRTKWRRARL